MKKNRLPKVKDIYKKEVKAFYKDQTLLEAIETFNQNFFTAAPVINSIHEVIGYLSESDCLKFMANSLFFDDFVPTIELSMSKDIICPSLESDIFELETFFVSKGIVSAPILNDQDKLIGIVTRRDVLVALEELMINKYKPPRLIEGLQVNNY